MVFVFRGEGGRGFDRVVRVDFVRIFFFGVFVVQGVCLVWGGVGGEEKVSWSAIGGCFVE